MKKAETFSKIASLLLAAVLITGIAAGCGKTEEPSSLDLSSASLDSFPVSSEPDVEVDPDNYIVWQVYDDSYADIWQKKINTLLKEKGADYTVKIEAYDSIFGASEEKSTIEILKEMKDSGTQADVISIRAERQASLLDPNSGEFIFEHEEPYQDAVAESILLSLDDYLETPAGQQLTDAIHPVDLERSKINGSSYGISQTLRQVRALFFNKEYLDKYHIKTEDLSPNIFENEELLQMIKEEEKGAVPPYVRMRLTYQVLGPRIWNVLGDGPFSYQSQTDSFVNVFETETCKELYRQLYALKDKNLAIEGVDGKGFDDFFVTEGIVSTDQVFETTYTFLDSNDQEVQKKVVVVPNMDDPYIGLNWGDSANGIASWSNRKDDAFDFLVRLFTDPDIANLIQYGVEGEDYTLQDGVAYPTEDSLLIHFSSNFTNPLITYPSSLTSDDKRAFVDAYYPHCEPDMPNGFRFKIDEVFDEVQATMEIMNSDTVDNLVFLRSNDVEASFEEINAQLKEAGIDKILAEAERQLEEWRNEN